MNIGKALILIWALSLLAGCAGRAADTGPGGGAVLPGLPADRVRVSAVDQRADRSLDPDLAMRFKARVERALAPAADPGSAARHELRLSVVEHSVVGEVFQGRRLRYPRWSGKTLLAAQLRAPDGEVLRNWKAAGWAGGVQPERTTSLEIARQSFEQALARLLKAMGRYHLK